MRGADTLAAVLLMALLGRGLRAAEDDGDSAPFTILVEHGDGWRCFGSLVSLRTALTSAWCARGSGARPTPELWARPAHAVRRARRVVRVALVAASEAVAAVDADDGARAGEGVGDPWRGVAEDLAVLELESPFGEEARAIPILMATRDDECAPPSACHTMHALPGRGAGAALRIVDVSLVAGERCAARGPRWSSLRPSALCLAGATLCAGDWGAGVVCAGKLCAVVSRSAGAERDARRCGDTHMAQAVPRWRRFLHCALTLRTCGSDGECAHRCVEKSMAQEVVAPTAIAATPTDAPEESAAAPTRASTGHLVSTPRRTPLSILNPNSAVSEKITEDSKKTRWTPPERTLTRSPVPKNTSSAAPVVQTSLEFEPNRPDFRAGEYGDNGAEYGGEELPGGGAPTRTLAPPRAPSTRPRARAPSPAQLAEARLPVSRSASRSSSDHRCATFILVSHVILINK